MSTVAIVIKNNTLAIAADTLTKGGSEKNSAKYVINHQKILNIGDNYLGITGPQSGQLAVVDYFTHLKNMPDLSCVSKIYKTWLKLHAALKEDYFLDTHKADEPQFEPDPIEILIANPHGAFGLSAYRDVQQFSRFYACGAGGPYAMGAMFAAYDHPQKTALEIAILGIEAACEFDDATALPMTSFTLPCKLPHTP
jgi:ATP-dependent protease HslVU (ClpYQ) peptidase subunit